MSKPGSVQSDDRLNWLISSGFPLTLISPNCLWQKVPCGFVIRFSSTFAAVYSRQWSLYQFFSLLCQSLKPFCMFTLTFSPILCFASCVAADIISTVEFNSSGELLATGDKGGRVVVFQREQEVGNSNNTTQIMRMWK